MSIIWRACKSSLGLYNFARSVIKNGSVRTTTWRRACLCLINLKIQKNNTKKTWIIWVKVKRLATYISVWVFLQFIFFWNFIYSTQLYSFLNRCEMMNLLGPQLVNRYELLLRVATQRVFVAWVLNTLAISKRTLGFTNSKIHWPLLLLTISSNGTEILRTIT